MGKNLDPKTKPALAPETSDAPKASAPTRAAIDRPPARARKARTPGAPVRAAVARTGGTRDRSRRSRAGSEPKLAAGLTARRQDPPEATAGSTWPPGAWDPVRRGETFCSPACGGGCTHRAYLLAVGHARALAAHMGPAWVPRIWENLGWHGEVCVVGEAGRISVSVPDGVGHHGGVSFLALLSDRPDSMGGRWAAHAGTARAAVQAVMQQAIADRDQIQRALASVEKAFLPTEVDATPASPARGRARARRGRDSSGKARRSSRATGAARDAAVRPIVLRPTPGVGRAK